MINRSKGTVFHIPKAHGSFTVHKGDIVTIAYNSFKRNNIPEDPVIVCKRSDLHWDDIVLNNTKKLALNCMFLFVVCTAIFTLSSFTR